MIWPLLDQSKRNQVTPHFAGARLGIRTKSDNPHAKKQSTQNNIQELPDRLNVVGLALPIRLSSEILDYYQRSLAGS
jgi:hypothetical protein